VIKQQAVLAPAGDHVQTVTDPPEKVLSGIKRLVFILGKKIMRHQVLQGVGAEVAFGHPGDHLYIAQAARAFLDVGFQLVLRIVIFMAPFGLFLINTLIVVTGILAVQMVTVTLAAYVFARRQFRGANILFLLFLVQMMIPIHATFLPNFLTLRSLDLLNTRVAMMLPFFASGYGTFLLRQAFRQIPRDLEDAAVIDGCGGLRFLWHVLIPLAKPTLVAFGLISLVSHWNDYLWPLIVTDTPDVRTLTIGLGMFVQQESGADWTLLMAATVFVTAPLLVIFLVFQRKFIESFMFTGLKG